MTWLFSWLDVYAAAWRVLVLLLVSSLSLIGCSSVAAEEPPTITPQPTPTYTPRPTPTLIVLATATVPAEEAACIAVPDLVYGQHLSASGSYTETETEAAGRMICRISPGSCAYNYLVGNLDPQIVFKREEEPPYDREDILMHPDMLMPLYRLNELVLSEWDGELQLRITDAYDSLLEHDLAQTDESRKYSLHFEGRSVDLTTWPIRRETYGRLCALAHCAGFDWVHNEGDHCHASIRAESLCLRCRE